MDIKRADYVRSVQTVKNRRDSHRVPVLLEMINFCVVVCSLTIYLLIEFCDVDAVSHRRMIYMGTTEVDIDEHPWQAALYINGTFLGGATIISSKYILTSAVWVSKYVSNDWDFTDITIVVGTARLDNRLSENHDIYDIYIHPDRTDNYPLPNDIAIISLITEIIFDKNKQPIPLPDADVPVRVEVTTTGWGLPSWGTFTKNLKKQVLKVIDNSECDKIKDQFNRHLLTTKLVRGQLCTLPVLNRWDCQGDIGGPLVYNGVLVGIKSWGHSCFQGHPTIHTRVHEYLSWIKKTMNMD